MRIELQLTTGDEEWTINLTEAVIPAPGDGLTIDDTDGTHVTSRWSAGGFSLPRANPWHQSW